MYCQYLWPELSGIAAFAVELVVVLGHVGGIQRLGAIAAAETVLVIFATTPNHLSSVINLALFLPFQRHKRSSCNEGIFPVRHETVLAWEG